MENNFTKYNPHLPCTSTTKSQAQIPQICKLPKIDAKVPPRRDVDRGDRPPCRRESAAKSHDTAWLTIHQQFTTYGRNAKEWMRKCALLLPEIARKQIWRRKRFHDIYDYAAKLAGMSHNQVNDALRIVGKAENLPALKEVINLKGLNAVRPIIAIATAENQQFLAEKAMSMSKNTLETFVRHFRRREVVGMEIQPSLQIDGRPSTSAQSVNLQISNLQSQEISSFSNSQNLPFESQSATEPSQKVTLVLQLNPELADQLQKLKGQGDWNELMKEFLKLKREKLEENKPAMVEVKNKSEKCEDKKAQIYRSRTAPAAIKKYVIAKTNSTCAFPGCTKPYKILHHTNRFAQFHTHDPDHIIPLCEAHENLAHLGLIENENQPPQYWKLRAQPDYNDPKYEVDRVVEKHRQSKR